MHPPRPSLLFRWRQLAAAFAGLGLALAAAPAAEAQGRIGDLLAAPTPLILKDGRIAHVSVHVVPFRAGSEDYASGLSEDRLAERFAAFATDCFLTAQAIGHVRPDAVEAGDSLSAHRLARTRADKVHAALAGLGIPSHAIASVWDWQFVVEEPRVTVWIFRLNQGEDCEGRRLEPGEAVAATTPQAETEAPAAMTPSEPPTEPAAEETASAPGETATGTVVEGELPEPEEAARAEDAARADDATTAAEEAETTGPDEPDEGELAAAGDEAEAGGDEAEAAATPRRVEPRPLTEREAAAAALRRFEASEEEEEDGAAAETAAAADAVSAAGEDAAAGEDDEARMAALAEGEPVGEASVTFDVNSSFFSGGHSQTLRAFVESLPEGRRYTVRLAVAVGSGDVEDATPEEARRYNRWMAERRADRVEEWLASNAGGRDFVFRREYRENDNSRQVAIEALPQG